MNAGPEPDDKVAFLRGWLHANASDTLSGAGRATRALALLELGNLLFQRAGQQSDSARIRADLDEAVARLDEALSLWDVSDPRRSVVRCGLGAALAMRYLGPVADPDDAERAIALLTEVTGAAGIPLPVLGGAHAALGQVFMRRAMGMAALDPETWQQLRTADPRSAPGPDVIAALFRATGPNGEHVSLTDLDAAVPHLIAALESAGLPEPMRQQLAGQRDMAMMMRQIMGVARSEKPSLDGLDREVVLGLLRGRKDRTENVTATAAADTLGLILSDPAALADPAQARELRDRLSEVADRLPPGDVMHGLLNELIGRLHLSVVGRDGGKQDAAEARRRASAALADFPPEHPFHADTLQAALRALLYHSSVNPSPDTLDETLAVIRHAIKLDEAIANGTAEGARARDPVTNRLGLAMALALRGMVQDPATGGGWANAEGEGVRGLRGEEVTEALDSLARLTGSLPPDDRRGLFVNVMAGSMLKRRHDLHGRLEDEDAAAVFLDRALGAMERGERLPDAWGAAAERTGAASFVMDIRFVRVLGALSRSDATAAADDLESLLADTPEDVQERTFLLALAGFTDLQEGVRHGDQELIARASARLKEARAAADATDDVARDLLLAGINYGTIMLGVATMDEALVEEAITRLRAEPEGSGFVLPMPPGLLLGNAHLAHHTISGSVGALDEAIDAFAQACEYGGAEFGRADAAGLLWQLASALHQRGDEARGDRGRAAEAGTASLRAIGCEVLLQATPDHALRVARQAARRSQIVAVMWWALDGHVPGAASEVVRALDLGRGLVLHTATSARSTAELLAAAGHQDLAEQWQAWQATQRHGPSALASVVQPTGAASSGAASEVFQSGAPHDPAIPSALRIKVVAALRDAGALDEVLDPPSVAKIASALWAAGSEALVYLVPALGQVPGRAVILRADGRLSTLVLPDLRDDQPDGAVRRYAEIHEQARGDEADPEGPEAASWRAALGDLCGWAWSAAMGPLLAEAGSWGRGDPERPVRLTLVPCGLLGIVPWHAARTAADAASGAEYRYACESAVISYTATGRQLVEATRRGLLDPSETPVLVGSPRDPDTRLTAVAVRGIRDACYPHAPMYGQVGRGREGTGTPGEVLAWFPGGASGTPASLLYLGCHAVAMSDPAASYLELAAPEDRASDERSGRLPVARILRQGMARTDDHAAPGGTVVLAACTSDLADADHDEALTLSSSLLAAGASSVVGSRWRVRNLDAAVLTFMFHHVLSRHGDAADALRETYLWMLDPHRGYPATMPRVLIEAARRRNESGATLADVDAWAAFTHQGTPIFRHSPERARPGRARQERTRTVADDDDTVLPYIRHRDEVREHLDGEARDEFDRLLHGFEEAETPSLREEYAEEIAFLLMDHLPSEHPMQRVLSNPDKLLSAGTAAPAADLDASVEFLRRMFAADAAPEPVPRTTSPVPGPTAEADATTPGALEPPGALERPGMDDPPDPDADDVLAELRRLMLEVPARSPEEIRSDRQNPDSTGLIRLRRADGGIQLPSFQFDADGEPLSVVLRINRLFRADRDPWGAASWWLDHNAWLLDVPAHLLGRGDDDRLVAAAQADLEVN